MNRSSIYLLKFINKNRNENDFILYNHFYEEFLDENIRFMNTRKISIYPTNIEYIEFEYILKIWKEIFQVIGNLINNIYNIQITLPPVLFSLQKIFK